MRRFGGTRRAEREARRMDGNGERAARRWKGDLAPVAGKGFWATATTTMRRVANRIDRHIGRRQLAEFLGVDATYIVVDEAVTPRQLPGEWTVLKAKRHGAAHFGGWRGRVRFGASKRRVRRVVTEAGCRMFATA